MGFERRKRKEDRHIMESSVPRFRSEPSHHYCLLRSSTMSFVIWIVRGTASTPLLHDVLIAGPAPRYAASCCFELKGLDSRGLRPSVRVLSVGVYIPRGRFPPTQQ